MAGMKEQIKTPEKELNNEEIVNLSDSEIKTLVIRMLAEMVEYRSKIEEEVKAIKSEIKEKYTWKETRTQINDLKQKEEMSIQPEQNKATRIQKNEERLRNLWDNFKCANTQIIGVLEGKKKSKKLKTYLKK